MLDVRLLGPVEASVDGRPARLGGARQRSLLALLALGAGRAVPAGRLIDELWPGRPPGSAEATLRTYVSRLRSSLGGERVAAQGGGYALAVDDDAVDATRFERLLRDGREALAAGAAGLAAERLRAALALWRGPALHDVGDGPALAAEARRLEELRFACVEARIEADLLLGRCEEVVAELQALAAAEPLRERLHAQLARALYGSGRQAEALDTVREAASLLDRELGLEPSAELRQLERAILRHELEAPGRQAPQHNLPAATTSFVGRERELGDLRRLLSEHRLVTLTGLGGSGKTRLALEAANAHAAACRDGVWLVDLAALASPDLVRQAAADAVGAEDAEGIVAYARTRELLLLLDNCEHVLDGCADLAETLLSACPSVRVLATSRLPLGVPGELDYAVDPLAPDDAGVRLFLDRAAAVRRGFEPERETVVRICRDLDGLPLAIELAAARVKALSPAEIAARLDDRFRFLRAWQRVADPRHQTLQTTMDWSYDLLDEDERRLLRRLSVFAGGAELAAIADVCLDGDADAALDLVARLVDASLVRAEPGACTRYRLLETVRHYAAAKLSDDPGAEDVRGRHARHYFRVAESGNLALDAIGRAPQNHEPVLREQHNLRAAIDWASTADVELALRLMLELENFWVMQAPNESRRRFEQLLEGAGEVDIVLRARAWRDYAATLDVLLELDRARTAYARSRELFAAARDEDGVAYLDFRLAVVAAQVGDEDLARRLLASSLATFRRSGNAVCELQVLGTLGTLTLRDGDVDRALELIETSVGMAKDVGWHWWVMQRLLQLAEVMLDRRDADAAEAHARGSLSLAMQIGTRQYALWALAVLARAAALRGEDDRALALWSSVEAVEDSPGRFGRFDRAAYARAMPPGPRPQPAPLEQAVALVLAG